MAVNAPYGVLVWMFWCYITEACNYINFNQLNQQENLHMAACTPMGPFGRPQEDEISF